MLVLKTFFMVAEEYPPPTATRGAWALTSPDHVDPGSPLFKPEKKESHSERRVDADMEDIVAFCEGSCGKHCHLRVPAEESDEVRSCSSGSKTRRYHKRGSPNQSKGDAQTAMEMTPSPVCRMFSALSDSEGYHTCYRLDVAGAEPDVPAGRSHTAPS